jgi:TRAP-type mannitol/chloroaromatic compound transport system permease small subunit
MAALRRLADRLDAITRWIGRAAAWMILLAVLVSAGNAVSRKAFSLSSNAMLELQWYLFGAVVMLCAAWTLQRGEHVRIDILSNRLSARARHRIDLVCHVVMLVPFAALMTWLSYPYFERAFVRNEVSLNAGGLVVWPMRAVILAGFGLLLVQAVSLVLRKLVDGPPEEAPAARDAPR